MYAKKERNIGILEKNMNMESAMQDKKQLPSPNLSIKKLWIKLERWKPLF